MSANEIAELMHLLTTADFESALIEELLYDVQFENTVSALEARLRGGYEFEEIISDALGTTMDFYDADCAIVISVDMQLQLAKCLYEVHREGFMPICGTQPMYLNEYPEIQQAMAQTGPLTILDVLSILPPESKSYKRIEAIGIRSIMALPYSKRSKGTVAVVNPRKFTSHNSMLQILSYVTAAEINEMNLMNVGGGSTQEENQLAKNEIYVKLLNGFELQTKEGIITEASIGRKQEILFLTLLLMQRGRAISEDALINLVWDDPGQLIDPSKTLKNLGYTAKRKVAHLFPENGLLQINKTGYAISRKYTITTDFDLFVRKTRDAEGIASPEVRLEKYMEALDEFTGVVLPNLDNQAIKRIADVYEQKRIGVQNECLSLMYGLEQYDRMREFINMTSISRNRGSTLYYWEIMAFYGQKKTEQARMLLHENMDRLNPEHRKELKELLTI